MEGKRHRTYISVSALVGMAALFILIPDANGVGDPFEQKVKQHLRDFGGHSAAIAVVTGPSAPILFAINTARPKTSAITTNSVMRVASVSKIVIALAALQELKGKGLNLKTPLDRLLPSVPIVNPWRHKAPITIQHLLEHTTGLQELVLPWQEPSPPSRLEKLISGLDPLEVHLQPGTTATYSNANYLLLNSILEQVSGESFDRVISRLLLDPLGMTNSTFRKELVGIGQLAEGYFAGNSRPVPIHDGPYQAAAGLYSSIEDMGRLLQMILNGGTSGKRTIIDRDIIEVAHKPATSLAARAGLKLGHGPAAVMRQTNGRTYAGHNGMIDGFSARLYYSLDRQEGYAIILNTHPLWGGPSLQHIGTTIEKYFFKPLELRVETTPVSSPLPPASEGFYQFQNPRFALASPFDRIFRSGFVSYQTDRLIFKPIVGGEIDYEPAGDGLFRRPWEPEPSLVFGADSKGRTYMFRLMNQYYLKSSPIPTYLRLAVVVLGIGALFIALIAPAAAAILGWRTKILWLPCATSATLIVIVALFLTLETSYAARSVNLKTVSIYLASLSLPALAIGGVFLALAHRKRYNSAMTWLSVGISGTLTMFIAYLGSYGWIGFRMF